MKEQNVNPQVRRIIEEFVCQATKAYGEGLRSVILYGSATSSEFIPGHSNVNLLVVLEDAALENLKVMATIFRKRSFSMITPLFLTEHYLVTSLDIFPIEFLDIKENYVVMYGKDVMHGRQVDSKNLRFQCEQELKSKLIVIKSAYVKISNVRQMRAFLFKAFTSIMHISRNLVRLKGKVPGYSKSEIIAQLGIEFSFDTTTLKRIAEIKQGNLRLRPDENEALLVALLKDLEHIIALVDTL
ncbi:MAG: hypothetical protein KBA46_00990 [Candidatus Omnitrophica bacterium]|nr:hypothetical protein [Candidatus Omnitrophota bacterium]